MRPVIIEPYKYRLLEYISVALGKECKGGQLLYAYSARYAGESRDCSL